MDKKTAEKANKLIEKTLDTIKEAAQHPDIYRNAIGEAVLELLSAGKTIDAESIIAQLHHHNGSQAAKYRASSAIEVVQNAVTASQQ